MLCRSRGVRLYVGEIVVLYRSDDVWMGVGKRVRAWNENRIITERKKNVSHKTKETQPKELKKRHQVL